MFLISFELKLNYIELLCIYFAVMVCYIMLWSSYYTVIVILNIFEYYMNIIMILLIQCYYIVIILSLQCFTMLI